MTDGYSKRITGRLKCLFGSHRTQYIRAEERVTDGATRHHSDGTEEPIDGCTIIEECERCGREVGYAASVDTAKTLGVPLTWESDSSE